jgi:Transposase IS66 family
MEWTQAGRAHDCRYNKNHRLEKGQRRLFYRVCAKRGSLLANVVGIVVHDHWKPYYTIEGVLHALCNAHHLRELKALVEIEKEEWARKMQRLLRRACHITNRARERGVPLRPRLRQYQPPQHPFRDRLSRGQVIDRQGKAEPLFAAFAKEVADGIHKMLVSDNTSVRLSEMEKALPHVTMEEDHAALRRIDFALAEHGETTAKWRGRLSPTSHATAINCAAPGAPDRPSGRPADRARSSVPAVATPRPAIRRGFE